MTINPVDMLVWAPRAAIAAVVGLIAVLVAFAVAVHRGDPPHRPRRRG